MKIEGIEITHPQKVYFPDKGITKGKVVEYYYRIAPEMLPFLRNRPLTLQRFPDGIGKGGFYQKHAQDYFPDYITRIRVPTEKGTAEEIMVNDVRSLVYLANQGGITFHIWLSQKDRLDQPDKVVYDLDPSDSDFSKVKKGARLLKDLLEKQGREPQLMTTGKRGLHVWYTLKPKRDYDTLRAEIRKTAEALVDRDPQLFTLEVRKEKRGNKVFIDTLRNSYAQTSVCPYSLRAEPGAGVATPLKWHELARLKTGDQYSYENIFRRLAASKS